MEVKQGRGVNKQNWLIEIFPFCGITGHMLVSFSPQNPGVRWVSLSHPRPLCPSLTMFYQSLQPRAGCSFPGRTCMSTKSLGRWRCPVSWHAATFCLCCSLCPAERVSHSALSFILQKTQIQTLQSSSHSLEDLALFLNTVALQQNIALCWLSQQDFQVISRRRRRWVLRESRPVSPLPVIILRDIYASVGQGLVQPFHWQLDGRTRAHMVLSEI